MWTKITQFDCWNNKDGTSPGSLYHQYGSPGGWFRRSYTTVRAADADQVTEEFGYIRAAAIFRKTTPLTPLTVDTAYSLVCNMEHKPWKIILVSVADPDAWLERAYQAGAQAWWLCEPGPVYVYRPIEHPDPGQIPDDDTTPVNRGAGSYDRDLVIQDLHAGQLNQTEIGRKYGITRSMVSRIWGEIRTADGPRRHRGPTTIPLTPEQQTAIIADIQAGTMTKLMIAERHGVPVNRITLLIDKYNLKGLLPRGGNAKRLSPKYHQNHVS